MLVTGTQNFQTFGEVIDAEVYERDTNIKSLAQQLGVGEWVLRRIRNGENGVSLRTLEELAPKMSDTMFERVLGLLMRHRKRQRTDWEI